MVIHSIESSAAQSKRAVKRRRLKQNKQLFKQLVTNSTRNDSNNADTLADDNSVSIIDTDDNEINELITHNPYFTQFKDILDKFNNNKNDQQQENNKDQADDQQRDDVTTPSISRRQLKQQSRFTVAELKQLVSRPDLVELHDVNAAEPLLLMHLKSLDNTVPVPSHWSSKTKYLGRKRGYEKIAYELPSFLADTGIGDIDQQQHDKQSQQTLKQQQRSKMQVKLNRVDIDYELLYNAFFHHQNKPVLNGYGDVYYEDKENQVKINSNIQPGKLSEQLRSALGMDSDISPPPYLHSMQRFGPPPAYPHQRIPGVNAPIPLGARWGFNINEWGKPPIDGYGRPLYGNLFTQSNTNNLANTTVEKTIDPQYQWGAIAQQNDDTHDDDEVADMDVADGIQSESVETSGIVTESTVGTNTPSTFQLRKDGISTESITQPLYHVIQQTDSSIPSNQLFATSHGYSMPNSSRVNQSHTQSIESQLQHKANQIHQQQRGEVEITLTPDELSNLDSDTLKNRYQQQLQQQKLQSGVSVSADNLHNNKSKKNKTFKF